MWTINGLRVALLGWKGVAICAEPALELAFYFGDIFLQSRAEGRVVGKLRQKPSARGPLVSRSRPEA
jgi:hypothetical protein